MATRKNMSRKSRKTRASRSRARSQRRRSTRHRGGMMDFAEATSGQPMLDRSMAVAARTAILDDKMAEIRGMQDGGRRSKARKSRAARAARKSAKGRSARKSRKSRKSRKQRGGQQELSQPTMLLPAAMYKEAGLNPEWKQY